MNSTKLPYNPSIQGAARVGEREQRFDLSLPTLVLGLDAFGNTIKEFTEITSISSQEVIFGLNSGVTIGSELDLSLEIPKTLLLENHLQLELSGRVTFIKANQTNHKKQIIALRLDQKFKINPLVS